MNKRAQSSSSPREHATQSAAHSLPIARGQNAGCWSRCKSRCIHYLTCASPSRPTTRLVTHSLSVQSLRLFHTLDVSYTDTNTYSSGVDASSPPAFDCLFSYDAMYQTGLSPVHRDGLLIRFCAALYIKTDTDLFIASRDRTSHYASSCPGSLNSLTTVAFPFISSTRCLLSIATNMTLPVIREN